MHRKSLIAAALTLALTGTSAVSTAVASTRHEDPIAHMAGDGPYVNPLGHKHHGHKGGHGDGYVNPLGGEKGKHNAYGRACAGESKEHVAGQPGTPFSECVRALAQLAKGQSHSPAKACRLESRKHADGEKGTPFSRCVAAGRKLEHHSRKHYGNLPPRLSNTRMHRASVRPPRLSN
ncbi:MAG TPA: hypothetical protein VE992_04260 [Solirubrobacteraceae bacterium]|nr:hypothetical protein [Solirubrobacteraceae bacterium]